MHTHSLESSIQSVMPANRRSRRLTWQNTLTFWGFVGPAVLGLVMFVYVPIFWGLGISLFDARYTVTPTDFLGLKNYQTLLTDRDFLQSLLTFGKYALFIVPVTYACSLGLAVLVNQAKWGKSIFRTIFFIPFACSYVVGALIWRVSLFNSLPYGFANMVLSWFGLPPVTWIGGVGGFPWHWVVLITVRLWLQLGFFMIIFLAGLQEIPKELYEAAAVDGATSDWMTFRHITLPLLRNTSVSVILLNLIWAFQAFDEFYNILGGWGSTSGNLPLARPPLIYIYLTAFREQNYGLAAAGGLILTVIILIFTLLQGKFIGLGKAEYE